MKRGGGRESRARIARNAERSGAIGQADVGRFIGPSTIYSTRLNAYFIDARLRTAPHRTAPRRIAPLSSSLPPAALFKTRTPFPAAIGRGINFPRGEKCNLTSCLKNSPTGYKFGDLINSSDRGPRHSANRGCVKYDSVPRTTDLGLVCRLLSGRFKETKRKRRSRRTTLESPRDHDQLDSTRDTAHSVARKFGSSRKVVLRRSSYRKKYSEFVRVSIVPVCSVCFSSLRSSLGLFYHATIGRAENAPRRSRFPFSIVVRCADLFFGLHFITTKSTTKYGKQES